MNGNDSNILSRIPDSRRANKAQLALFFGVSVQAIDGWIRRGCPYVERGAIGTRWQFDLLAVARWRFAVGISAPNPRDPDSMEPADRLWFYSSETKRRDLVERDLKLLEAGEAAETVSSAFHIIDQAVVSLGFDLANRADLNVDQAATLHDYLNEAREALAERLADLMGPAGD